MEFNLRSRPKSFRYLALFLFSLFPSSLFLCCALDITTHCTPKLFLNVCTYVYTGEKKHPTHFLFTTLTNSFLFLVLILVLSQYARSGDQKVLNVSKPREKNDNNKQEHFNWEKPDPNQTKPNHDGLEM